MMNGDLMILVLHVTGRNYRNRTELAISLIYLQWITHGGALKD